MKLHVALFSYGGIHHRTFDALREELRMIEAKRVPVRVIHTVDDALISRSRSKALSDFLLTDGDVFFMLDHDIQWTPGELLATADVAHLKKAAVAGFYATRAKRGGYAGRLPGDKTHVTIGRDELHDAEFLPGGFTAIPRKVAEAVLAAGKAEPSDAVAIGSSNFAVHRCLYFDGTPFYDFFRPIAVPTRLPVPSGAPQWEYLSEDWAFSYRVAGAGQRQFLWSRPVLAHFGEYGFTMQDSIKGNP